MSRTQSHGVDVVAVTERLERLSRRQRDIAERYANGLTYKQIAAELFIAPATVQPSSDDLSRAGHRQQSRSGQSNGRRTGGRTGGCD